MNIGTFIFRYFAWHYSRALTDLWRNSQNAVWFVYNFFSTRLLLRTFFAPWKRMDEDKTTAWFERLVINTMMRLFGMVCRASLLAVGFLALGLTIAFAGLFFLLWLFLPLLVLALFFKGLALLLPHTKN